MPIQTQRDLHQHLELAIEVELATIPPYLYAMYSIADSSSESALLLRSIVVEEMLHVALATNLLLATGGKPDFRSTRYLTTFPANLPHHVPPLAVDLAPCSTESIQQMFMRIEKPETRAAPPQPDRFETLGQFYHALELGIDRLARSSDLFANPQLDAQLSDPRFYRPVRLDADDSGGLMLITDSASAKEAIEVIIHQGEGLSDERWADPSHQELTHYYKLVRIADGTSPIGAVRPVRTNPRSRDYTEPLRPVSHLFNAIYRSLFFVLARIFEPGSDKSKAVGVLYLLMGDVMSHLARFLVEQPLGNGEVAAPTFEIYEFKTSNRLTEAIELAAASVEPHPDLSPVHDALRGLGFIL